MLRLRLLREKDPDLFQKTCQVLGKAVIACGLNPTKLSERCLFALYGIVDNIACGDINLEQLQRFVSSLTIERKGLPEALASVTGRTESVRARPYERFPRRARTGIAASGHDRILTPLEPLHLAGYSAKRVVQWIWGWRPATKSTRYVAQRS